MDMTVIDITDLKEPKAGEEVVVYSSKIEDKNSVANMVNQITYDKYR